MRIPELEATGGPTVSPTMLRRYGVSGVDLPGQEADQGCPRRFRAHYVDRTAPPEDSYVLVLGKIVHEALQIMSDDGVSPDAALERCFPADLGPEAYDECLTDLVAYMERGAAPTDRFAVLAAEQHLTAPLFTDEDGTTYWLQGYIDALSVDPEEPHTLHVTDFKHQRHPASYTEVRRSLQFRFYDLLVRKNLHRYIRTTTPSIVVHLDAIKFSDVAVRYSQDDADVFEQWLISMVKHIVADQEAKPVLNPGCGWCPVRADCPAFAALPDVADQVAATLPGGDTDDDVLAWRDRANQVRLLLAKAVKDVDERFADRAHADGGVYTTGREVFTVEPKYTDEVDLRALHTVLGDTFYDVATTSKAAVKRAVKGWPASEVATVETAINRVTTGSKVVRTRREDER